MQARGGEVGWSLNAVAGRELEGPPHVLGYSPASPNSRLTCSEGDYHLIISTPAVPKWRTKLGLGLAKIVLIALSLAAIVLAATAYLPSDRSPAISALIGIAIPSALIAMWAGALRLFRSIRLRDSLRPGVALSVERESLLVIRPFSWRIRREFAAKEISALEIRPSRDGRRGALLIHRDGGASVALFRGSGINELRAACDALRRRLERLHA